MYFMMLQRKRFASSLIITYKVKWLCIYCKVAVLHIHNLYLIVMFLFHSFLVLTLYYSGILIALSFFFYFCLNSRIIFAFKQSIILPSYIPESFSYSTVLPYSSYIPGSFLYSTVLPFSSYTSGYLVLSVLVLSYSP